MFLDLKEFIFFEFIKILLTEKGTCYGRIFVSKTPFYSLTKISAQIPMEGREGGSSLLTR